MVGKGRVKHPAHIVGGANRLVTWIWDLLDHSQCLFVVDWLVMVVLWLVVVLWLMVDDFVSVRAKVVAAEAGVAAAAKVMTAEIMIEKPALILLFARFDRLFLLFLLILCGSA
jgi:hypothetical protein